MSKKIIVAEDSSVIQNLTKRILTQQNYVTTSVKNGAQVLDKLDKDTYDMVLMDINMPVMDGIACAKEIRLRSKDNNGQIPIIAITGNANNYSREDFKAVGIDNFISKPLNYDLLVETVKNHFENGD
ncbi:MAG: two-component system cell cycle response regulator DivK [Cyclobacteriaceae bacterium]|jgi:CheY-like chemotaxis protein